MRSLPPPWPCPGQRPWRSRSPGRGGGATAASPTFSEPQLPLAPPSPPSLPPPRVSPGVATGRGGRPARLGSPEPGEAMSAAWEPGEAMSAAWGQACLPVAARETGGGPSGEAENLAFKGAPPGSGLGLGGGGSAGTGPPPPHSHSLADPAQESGPHPGSQRPPSPPHRPAKVNRPQESLPACSEPQSPTRDRTISSSPPKALVSMFYVH